MKCHGADGTGSPARGDRPEIPNFTKASWQARRSDAQIMASILDGKGLGMPPGRGKISAEQARGLVAYVRAFAPTTGKSRQEEQEGPAVTFPRSGQGEQERPARVEPAEAKPPRGFFEKLIRWLGKFHPAAVHFPIALLTAAAMAELLRMATGQPAFDAVARCCVWFGALTAVVAGVLGWFRGGFLLADASWVLRTHRWLGTATVACAGLVLVLSEVSRRPDRRRTRMWFRGTLLVVAVLVLVTGFFGGAVVFGLDHYTWPQGASLGFVGSRDTAPVGRLAARVATPPDAGAGLVAQPSRKVTGGVRLALGSNEARVSIRNPPVLCPFPVGLLMLYTATGVPLGTE
ncbi:MAG: c-type cytochrome [Gemmataceae bacterium]|nr:c-type cytochrome [Gemmataceae bacterium]